MFDYTLKVSKDGKTLSNSYQTVISKLGIENEIVSGAPLKEGGAPQALMVARLIKEAMKAESVTVYFQGNAILAA
jgi:hypothetical protein